MRQVLGPGALGRPRGIGWRGRWEGGSGWGIYVTPWLIHVNVWQNPRKCCEIISLQLIKINEKEKKERDVFWRSSCYTLTPLKTVITQQSRRVCMLSHFSHAQLFETLWTAACQGLPSMGFSRWEYWCELPCPPPGDLPDPGVEPMSPRFRQILYHLSHQGSP